MIHTRRLTQAERDGLTVLEDGAFRSMTDQELLDVGWKVLGQDINGDWIMDCCILQHPDGTRPRRVSDLALPGVALGEGPAQGVRSRFHRLDPEATDVALRAQVVRQRGASLRARLNAELGQSLAARQRVTDAAALARAQALVEDEGEPVERQTVTRKDVQAGDILEADDLPAHRWSREPM